MVSGARMVFVQGRLFFSLFLFLFNVPFYDFPLLDALAVVGRSYGGGWNAVRCRCQSPN